MILLMYSQKDINMRCNLLMKMKRIFSYQPLKNYIIYLKQSPELSNKIGLLIYGEGHQFE